MKLISNVVLLSLITIQLCGQTINGKVIDSSNGEPLAYVSIGVINSSIGGITDEKGNFKIDYKGQPSNAMVRFSMISYAPQTFTIEELVTKEKVIKLTSVPLKLAEVIVKPSGKERKVGTTSYTRIGNLCGWGGSFYRKGHEVGTKIELGSLPVQIKSIRIHVHRQAFDSSLYRLHIRNIVDSVPFEELLTTNVIFKISKESGWVDIDLRKYNIVLKGDVAVSLEWIKVYGVKVNREIKINNKMTKEYVLFNMKKRQGCSYTRRGTEAKWIMHCNGSPSFYLTVH